MGSLEDDLTEYHRMKKRDDENDRLRAEVRSMHIFDNQHRGKIAALEADNAAKDARIAALEIYNATQRTRIEALEAMLVAKEATIEVALMQIEELQARAVRNQSEKSK